MRLHFNAMRLCFRLLIRPLCFLILLALASLMILRVCVLVEQFKNDEVLQAHQLRNKSVSAVEHTAQMIAPLNASTANLARYLSSVLNGTALSFSTIQQKIAPSLFETLLTTPDVTEVGYNGFDGLRFMYFKENRQTFARFSNSSESPVIYTQPANRETGELFGEAALFNSTHKWNKTKGPFPYFQLEEGSNDVDLMFSNIFRMDGRGEVSMKFPVQKAVEKFNHLDLSGGLLHLAANGKVLMQTKLPEAEIFVENTTLLLKWKKENGDYDRTRNASCLSGNGNGNGNFAVKISQNQHEFYCSTVKLAGIDSVYVLTFRVKDEMESAALVRYTLALLILVLILLGIIFSLCLFIFLILKAARREIVLCNALIKQKESTHQAERKSMSMSHAFATNSHDLRASLKVLTVLVEECHEDVVSKSRLKTNLTKINAYVQDLLGLLSNVLDQSKIEADKIELKDEEFNLTQVLEEVVDRFYTVGLRKGVDILLDLSDGSVLKFSHVRGDKERLKQVLLNLLSNATKFTSQGHVVIRTTVQKRSEENAILAHNDTSLLNRMSRLWCTKTSANNMASFLQHPDCMEFIFEVDDTGCGIPKERRQFVFENYVQVKKHDSGKEGWGLGLGIVQSLVRMMGGEIKIVEKEGEEKGTCFRFNIFLIASNPVSNPGIGDNENLRNRFGLHKVDGSHVVLLLHGKERQKVSRTFLENFGIRVSVAKTGSELEHILCEHTQPNLSEKSEEGCSGTKDGHDSSSPLKKNPSFVLVVIDSAVETSSEVNSVLSSFNENRGFPCKIVWWEKKLRNQQIQIPPYDYVLSKPLHGSVLYEMLGLLPEFHGAFLPSSFKLKEEAAEIEELEPSIKYICSDPGNSNYELQEIVVHGKPEDEGPSRPLLGKTVLVVDDDRVLQRVTSAKLSQLGAQVDVCNNGKEAVDLVCQCLNDEGSISPRDLPYDYIFMDCQMPVLDGYEAMRLIREEEKRHGIRMPIFALTCNSSDDDENTRHAGMDYHLGKPFKLDKLMEAVRNVKSTK